MIKRFWKRLGVQLGVWYFGIFAASSLIILTLSFLLLHSYLVKEDKAFVLTRATEFESSFRKDGFDAMMREIKDEIDAGFEPFFVRVADVGNRTVFSNGPDFARFGPEALDGAPPVAKTWTHLSKSDDEDMLDVYTVDLADGHFLQIGKTSRQRNAPLERFLSLATLVAIPVVVIGLVGGVILSTRTFRPLRRLITTVEAITKTGQLETRVPAEGSRDELDDLVSLFNKMLDRVERVVGGLRNALDNVAHDLRTPMTRLRNTAEEALQSEAPLEGAREALADCLEQSDEAITMLRTLMDISEAETGTLKLKSEPLDFSEVVADVTELYQHVADEKKVTLRTVTAGPLPLSADRYRLRQALANLVDNAIKYSPSGEIRIEAERKDGALMVRVRDHGPGIPTEDLDRIWARLFRGDNSRGQPGLGLGLSLVRAIVRAHGGTVAASNNADGGATFTLSFPA